MLDWSHSPSVRIACDHLSRGEVVAYPTEAVWGLGCDPFNEDAVFNILSLKNRHMSKGLILIASDVKQFSFILKDLSETQQQQLLQTWPGPYTWIVPHNNRVPYWVTGRHTGVALRVSAHPLVRALCHRYGGPIVSTSANPQAKPAAEHYWQVMKYFKHNPLLAYLCKGPTGSQKKPSTIKDLISGKVLR